MTDRDNNTGIDADRTEGSMKKVGGDIKERVPVRCLVTRS